MDLKEIQDKLNSMLTGTGRKLVFWYDDDGSYEENIHDFELVSGTKLWIVTDSNWFETMRARLSMMRLPRKFPQN